MEPDAMRLLLASTSSRIMRAWGTVIRHLRDANPVAALALSLSSRGDNVLADVHAAATYFASEQHLAYVHVGQRTAKALSSTPVRKKLIGFDVTDPPAVAWARTNSLDKIREITEDVRSMIRAVLIDAARSGENPLVTATRIRDSIGLTEAQVRMVDSYRRSLEAGQYAAALDRELSSGVSDRVIAAAQRKDKPLTPAQIDTAVEWYRSNALTMRAETIARTEGLRVAHQAADEAIRQAVESGDVEAKQILRTWHAAHDPRTRSTHAAMDEQDRGFGETFTSGAGVELAFPGDPSAPPAEVIQCRCVVTTRIRPIAA